mgnify:CR=1 FL=1
MASEAGFRLVVASEAGGEHAEIVRDRAQAEDAQAGDDDASPIRGEELVEGGGVGSAGKLGPTPARAW